MAPLPSYSVKESPKAKHLRLKVTPQDGLCVIVPRGFDPAKIPAILNQKKKWIADALAQAKERRRFFEQQPVEHLPERMDLRALGEVWAVAYRVDDAKAGLWLRGAGDELTISGVRFERTAVICKLREWLRRRVRDCLFPLAYDLAEKYGLPIRVLLVKNQRTRWASCSAHKNLSLNIKLLFLAPGLVRYVLLHELCHTVHMNHTKEFWRLLASYEPRYRALDQSLRDGWKIVPQWMF